MDRDGKSVPILDYATPPQRRQRPRCLTAFLLCLPGLVCWYVLISFTLGLSPIPHPYAALAMAAVSLPVAVLTALISIVYYWERPKPWYVALCLTSNILGLGFLFWFLFLRRQG